MSCEATALERVGELVFELSTRGDGVQAAFLLGATEAMYGWPCEPADGLSEREILAYSAGWHAGEPFSVG